LAIAPNVDTSAASAAKINAHQLIQDSIPTKNRISAFHELKLVFPAAALFSLVLSVTLWLFADREMGVFVGLWSQLS
jgi:hypothetical protein